MSKKMKVFACCLPVQGAVKSIVCDMQRNDFDEIPNSLFEILTKYDGCSVEEIKAHYAVEEHEIIDEYLDFLVERQYVFFTNTPEAFPPLNLQWDAPQLITNALLDVDHSSTYDIDSVIAQLTDLRCASLEVRFFDHVPFAQVERLLMQTQHSSLRSVSLVLCYQSLGDVAAAEALFSLPAPLTNVLLHSYEGEPLSLASGFPIFTTPVKVRDETHCGVISPYNFTVNVLLFTESQYFNNCLNRKLSVDRHGFIKNCPSCVPSYGNVRDTLLRTAMENPAFSQVWAVKKDDIEVCRDCEYRYICVDCRAYQPLGGPLNAKPVKCQYDPYTATYTDAK